jgi:hypothetical protein
MRNLPGNALTTIFAASLAACGAAEQAKAAPVEAFSLEAPAPAPRRAPFAFATLQPGPVLLHGPTGAWDGVDALNPSVVRFREKLYNYYSGFDGTLWRTGLATSDDGRHWLKSAKNQILSPGAGWASSYIAANGASIIWEGKILYYYQGRDSSGVTLIGMASSEDGTDFTESPAPVLDVGAPGTWDGKAVGDPYAISHNGRLYLYFLGMNALDVQRRMMASIGRSSQATPSSMWAH